MSLVRALSLLFALVAVAALGFWAGRVALEPPEDPLAGAQDPITYVVDTGSVGRSLTFTAIAEWELVPVGLNSAAGVVTSVNIEPGATVDAGALIYTVNLRPTVIAEGTVPMFRTLALRATGPDVAQLQTLLARLGHYSGNVDGEFGLTTRTAVRDWQETMGLDRTGIVEVGDLAFVPSLPVRITLAESFVVGARVFGGEEAILLVPDDPDFLIPLAVEQATLVPLSADVLVIYPDGVWPARVIRAEEQVEFGRLNLHLEAPGGGSVCGGECAEWVPLRGRTDFRSQVVVIPEVSGPVVPVAAISTDTANQASVTLVDGSVVPVEIIESANGIAVVEGIDLGTEILVRASGQ